MKLKVLLLVVALFTVVAMFSPPVAIAQDSSAVVVVKTTDPVSTPDVLGYFGTITGLASLVLLFTAYAKKALQSNDTITIILSAVISLILSGIGSLLQLGIFGGVPWYYIVIYGLVACLIANGASTWPVIAGILTLFKLKVPKSVFS